MKTRNIFVAGGVLLVLAIGIIAFSKSRRTSNSVDLKAGLIAHWPAEGRGRDASGKFIGTVTGSVEVVSGDAGSMFSFGEVRGSVVVTDAPKLNVGSGQDFSITARIQPKRADTAFGVMSIVDKRQVGGSTAARGYSLHLEYGRLACQLAPAARWPTTVADFSSPARIKSWWQRRRQLVPMTFARYVSTGPDLRDGMIHEVALTVERNSQSGGKLYVDGAVVLTFDPRKQAATLGNAAPLLIGGHPDRALNCGFQGSIGNARLYSRALSAAEIAALSQKVGAGH